MYAYMYELCKSHKKCIFEEAAEIYDYINWWMTSLH